MNKLGAEHIAFLKVAADKPNKIHESELPVEDLQQMVDEGLLLKYKGVKVKYCITRAGTHIARSNGDSLEMIKVAQEYVKSRGYSQEAAESIVKEHGAEMILKSKLEEGKEDRQRGVTVPTNAQGVPEIRPIKS